MDFLFPIFIVFLGFSPMIIGFLLFGPDDWEERKQLVLGTIGLILIMLALGFISGSESSYYPEEEAWYGQR